MRCKEPDCDREARADSMRCQDCHNRRMLDELRSAGVLDRQVRIFALYTSLLRINDDGDTNCHAALYHANVAYDYFDDNYTN